MHMDVGLPLAIANQAIVDACVRYHFSGVEAGVVDGIFLSSLFDGLVEDPGHDVARLSPLLRLQ